MCKVNKRCCGKQRTGAEHFEEEKCGQVKGGLLDQITQVVLLDLDGEFCQMWFLPPQQHYDLLTVKARADFFIQWSQPANDFTRFQVHWIYYHCKTGLMGYFTLAVILWGGLLKLHNNTFKEPFQILFYYCLYFLLVPAFSQVSRSVVLYVLCFNYTLQATVCKGGKQ